MAEFQRMPTQEELQKILYMGQMQGKTTQEIINENLAKGGTVKPLPENFFTTASAGAKRAGEYINRAGTAADVAKLFPGYQPETKVTIPTSFSVVPKVDPYSGQVMPTGIQTQQASIGNVLQQIKPADVLGVSGAERAYGDIGAGKAPQPFDVIDTLGVGAVGMAGTKGLLGAARATKGLPVGMSIQDVTKSGLLATAPKSEIGFYSAVENAALASPRKTATGQAFLNDIMKGQDVRADEIKWLGLDDYLKDKKSITKQEVQDYIANNRVDVQEVQLGAGYAPIQRELNNQGYELNVDMDGDWSIFKDNQYVDLDELPQDLQNFVINNAPSKTETKFGQYTLPGGENYREILLTMPNTKQGNLGKATASSDGDVWNVKFDNGETTTFSVDKANDVNEAIDYAQQKLGTSYRSSHFDQPNILAHLRVNDRVDADGKKMLLIEEVQSDWHQAGRDKGYLTKDSKQREANLEAIKEHESIMNQIGDMPWSQVPQEIKDRLNSLAPLISDPVKKVPDAPFKDTWYQLALKRAIQHAAENGYERIGLTTGSQQAARFDLSRQVNEIAVPMVNSDGSRSVRIDPTNGTSLKLMVDKDGIVTGYGAASNQFSGKKLNEVIGKEMADKVMKSEPETVFSGLDLQVGGEGMKKYYDEIYPKFLDKYGKKWGAKVGETKISTAGGKPTQYADYYDYVKSKDAGSEKVRYIDITPEMKAGVSKGQPLFAAAPIGVTGGLLGTQQDQRK
jgi:hypothetical protein